MKKLTLFILAAAALAVSLTACSAADSGQAVNKETAAKEDLSAATVSDESVDLNSDEYEDLNSDESSDSNYETETSETSSIAVDEELAGLLQGAAPASEAACCDGFDDLSWGSTIEDFPESASIEVVCRGKEFAGYYGSAYYNFDSEGRLVMGVYRLNETVSLEWIEALKIYLNVKNYLISQYGNPSEEVHRAPGPSTIEELIEEGGGAWSEMWTGLTSSTGDSIMLTAILQGNGMMEIQFLNTNMSR